MAGLSDTTGGGRVLTGRDMYERSAARVTSWPDYLSASFNEMRLGQTPLGVGLRLSRLPDPAPTRRRPRQPGAESEDFDPDFPYSDFLAGARERRIDLVLETEESLQARREAAGAIDAESWRASPWFREGIEWDEGMTEERARVMADMFDEMQTRNSATLPITSRRKQTR